MKFAVIAAGEGSRLVQEGVKWHKPLVRLNGEPMLDRLMRIFTAQGASELIVIVNDRMRDVVDHARHLEEERRGTACPLRLVVKSTPSSMHSFYEISRYLGDEPFCLTTVDTIFRETDFSAYISAFSAADADGLMAVTDYIDDEKPLYVGTDTDMNITGFFDERGNCQYISGGIYCLKSNAIGVLHRCIESGQSRMRNFQRQLVKDGLHLKAYPFGKIIDVDHAGDIEKAEKFLQEK
jgi:NDP-sugar pyrophosphorylase family protein